MRVFTNSEIEKSEQISNDISEDIDNKDSKKELRTAVEYYADLHMKACNDLGTLQMKMEIIKTGYRFLDVALGDSKV